jgi:CheY-like chemotaxis protein
MDDAAKKTVIVIEDEPNVQLYLQTVLEDAGFNVLTAGDGESGLKMIEEQRPDLISLDLVLPKMSGRKVLKALQKNEELSEIPVLIVTAHADDDLGREEGEPVLETVWRPRSLNQGPGMFLRKPIKPLEYVQCIEKALGMQSSEEKNQRLEAKKELEELMRNASFDTLKGALEVLRKGS